MRATPPVIDASPMRSFARPLTIAGLIGAVGLAFAVWLTDFVTMSGEWTVYTAHCDAGSWNGDSCSGTMLAGERYRFRALKAHREVLFWVVGQIGESGRYTRCDIKDGRNWTCAADRQGPPTIANRMRHGAPVGAAADAPLVHRIPKWKWALLDVGLPAGHTASN